MGAYPRERSRNARFPSAPAQGPVTDGHRGTGLGVTRHVESDCHGSSGVRQPTSSGERTTFGRIGLCSCSRRHSVDRDWSRSVTAAPGVRSRPTQRRPGPTPGADLDRRRASAGGCCVPEHLHRERHLESSALRAAKRVQVAWDAVMGLGRDGSPDPLAVIVVITAVVWLLIGPWLRRPGGPRP